QATLNDTGRRTMSSLQIVRRGSDSAPRSPRAFAAGATRTFHVVQGTITGISGTCVTPQIKIGTTCYLDVPATLQSVSNHGYVWVDNGIDASYNFGAADFQATAAAFEADYARETAAFGPAFFNPNGNVFAQCSANGTRNTNPNTYAPPVDYTGADPHISVL